MLGRRITLVSLVALFMGCGGASGGDDFAGGIGGDTGGATTEDAFELDSAMATDDTGSATPDDTGTASGGDSIFMVDETSDDSAAATDTEDTAPPSEASTEASPMDTAGETGIDPCGATAACTVDS